jgi:ParB-like chromosome segregation protein Spo0J
VTTPAHEAVGTRAERTPLARLKPAPWNPRTVKTVAFKALCASLEADPDFLWKRPVLAQADGTIYGGNQRYRAAEALGWTDVPAVVEDVPERLAKERALRDNNASGEWHDQSLAELLYELKEEGAAVDGLAFDPEELQRLIGSVSGDAPDVAFKEYDETAAEGVEYLECPACGHRWPK